jgi:acetyl-CoA C-acetyltransferase
MREAVIVSTARTPIGRAYRGAFNDTHGADLAGHAIAHAVSRAGVAPGEVEDVILGCALQQGATGQNIARQSAIRAGLSVSTAGTTVDRQCSSGLQAIAIASNRVVFDGLPIAIGGGLESISLVQNDNMNRHRLADEWLVEHKPAIYMAMIDTAEIGAIRSPARSRMSTRWKASAAPPRRKKPAASTRKSCRWKAAWW